MKKCKTFLAIFFLMLTVESTNAQAFETQQLLLDIQKLAQLKQILKDLYKGYDILSKGYGAIKDISQGNFNLHKDFLDGLLAINPYVKQYKRVADIIQCQILIVEKANTGLKNFQSSDLFSSDEVSYMKTIYDNLINESANNIEDLTTVITADQLRMSDEERLAAIDRIYNDAQDKLMFLNSFNNSTSVLASQRKNEWWEAEKSKMLYGISK